MGTEADGENYGISYEGGLRSTHNTRQVFLDNFGFEAGDRFTYTYNFAAFWLGDIRIEAIEPLSTQITRCFGGSGCQSEDGFRYYKVDEAFALLELLAKVIKAKRPLPFSARAFLAEYRVLTLIPCALA